MSEKEISKATLKRLPTYLAYLKSMLKTERERGSFNLVRQSNPYSNPFSPRPRAQRSGSRPKKEKEPRPAQFAAKAGNGAVRGPFDVVPVAGVEPARYRYHGILSPARLPIPSHRLELV